MGERESHAFVGQCEACGKWVPRLNGVVWTDDGSPFCPDCLPPDQPAADAILPDIEAQRAEIERLKDLLVRYAQHVNYEEGSYFLDSYGSNHLSIAEIDEIRGHIRAALGEPERPAE